MKSLKLTTLLCLALFALTAVSEVRLPHVLSDHAVLQRGAPIHLWGWATPGAHLNAHFHAQTVSTDVDAIGTWSLYLAPESAGGPYTLTISGDGADTKVDDLLVGDVWFASGQSNMEFPLNGFPGSAVLKNGAQEIAAATNPKLRLLHVGQQLSDFPLGDSTGSWTTCTPETAATFSAVAYFFGREIAAKEDVPIGLIDSSWGGTPADSWVSLDTLGTNAQLLPAFAARARFANELTNIDLKKAEEQREISAAKAAGKPAPTFPWHPFEGSWVPAGIYNGMVAPFIPYSLKGFIWYQGETNSGPGRAPYYRTLFPALIEDWRMHFAQGNLPFLFVQISSFNSPGEDWGTVRDAQRRTLSVANTAMAVTLDIGEKDNVHPPDKQTVGARLALAARALVYGEPVVYRSPLFRQVTTELQPDGSPALRVWFDNAEKLNSHGKPVAGFEVAGNDRRYVPAVARIDGTTVIVSSPEVQHPVYVRYGWSSYFDTNLFNAAGLPASTFTSDDSPL
ncbi:MAG TPA: sialate O-acetylesterase [Acidobacteriaceae bacterium]